MAFIVEKFFNSNLVLRDRYLGQFYGFHLHLLALNKFAAITKKTKINPIKTNLPCTNYSKTDKHHYIFLPKSISHLNFKLTPPDDLNLL